MKFLKNDHSLIIENTENIFMNFYALLPVFLYIILFLIIFRSNPLIVYISLFFIILVFIFIICKLEKILCCFDKSKSQLILKKRNIFGETIITYSLNQIKDIILDKKKSFVFNLQHWSSLEDKYEYMIALILFSGDLIPISNNYIIKQFLPKNPTIHEIIFNIQEFLCLNLSDQNCL